MNEKEFRDKVERIFTPAFPAINNYISRNKIDNEFNDALFERGLQVIVYGPTGVGKSSLIWSTLEKNDLTYFRFAFDDTVNVENFCPKVMDKLGFQKAIQSKKGFESGTEAEIHGGATIWKLIDFKGKFKANSKKSTEDVYVPYYNDADIDAVAAALQKTDSILFLDDVEKADDQLRVLIAHLGKKLSDSSAEVKSSAKIIYAGVSQEVSKLIELDQSLRDRLADQLLEPLKDEEIEKILRDGWNELEFKFNEDELKLLSKLCCGYPRYAHWIGKQSALNAFRNGNKEILKTDIDISIEFIINKYRDKYQKLFDKATGHSTKSLRLREKILFAMASSSDIEVKIDYILEKCSEYVGKDLSSNQISGPLGELKKEKRGYILDYGRIQGSHRFTDLMIKPYIRMLMQNLESY